jgi:phosphate-selective porin
MAHGKVFSKILEYQVGFFTRDGANARTSQTEGGQNARAVRLVVSPFATSSHAALAPLDVGVAVMSSHLDERFGIRGRTVIGDGVFFDRVDVNGQRDRVGLEAAWALGPVGVSSEYMRLSDQRLGMGFGGADLPSVDATAWYLAGTWALTGERKHGRLQPHADFLRGGFGAIELAARVETLGFKGTTYPTTDFGLLDPEKLSANADHVTTVGVNWYLNHYAKVQLNVIREAIDDAERSPAPTANGHFTSTVIGMQFRF